MKETDRRVPKLVTNFFRLSQTESRYAVDGVSDDGVGVFFGHVFDVDAALAAADDARAVGFSRLHNGEIIFPPQIESLTDGDFVARSSLGAGLFGIKRVADHPRRDFRAFVRRVDDANAAFEPGRERTFATAAR